MSGTTSEWPIHNARRNITMRKYVMALFAVLAFCLVAPAAFAQATGAGGYVGTNWVAITSGFAMAIASGACGIAQGRASTAASESMARNPGAAGVIQNML